MKKIYLQLEHSFDKLTSFATAVLANSLTFLVAVVLVIFWLTEKAFYKQSLHTCIGDIILSVTFLSLFIIQKSFNRFSASLHLKVNELVASHETASNAVIGAEHKTENEIIELNREHDELITAINKEKASDAD